MPPTISLATLNAKYIHASLGLRYLMANMGALRPVTQLCEFTIKRSPEDVANSLLDLSPRIIGFGVYIWNVQQTQQVIEALRAKQPDILIVLGGPEVSHETELQPITQLADYIITGWGDISFPALCQTLLAGNKPLTKIIAGSQPPLTDIALPYNEFTDEDLAHRLLYVEASRGCPFKCEFCLSALDKTAWSFDLDNFLTALSKLYERGARNFKFVDRTFNLKIETSVRILQFFIDRINNNPSDTLFLHFEVVPDHLPDALKSMILQFPPGTLQFEVGIQSFNEEVQRLISRRQDNDKTAENLRWLVTHTHAHLHTDLIFGLPGETLDSFADGFDRLYALKPHEIQLGILKRLRGTPIARHTVPYNMVYDTNPPYTVLQTAALDAETVQRIHRFARYWDTLANSGRFKQTLQCLLAAATTKSPFNEFLQLADWLWRKNQTTQGLSPEFLVDALFDYLTEVKAMALNEARTFLLHDYLASGARSNPRSLQGVLPKRPPLSKNSPNTTFQLSARFTRDSLNEMKPLPIS